jgi:hypothetical protein
MEFGMWDGSMVIVSSAIAHDGGILLPIHFRQQIYVENKSNLKLEVYSLLNNNAS